MASLTAGPAPIPHAACDECRLRKLKCSGGSPCDRCRAEGTPCVYSPRKKMGRPRKRNRGDAETPPTHAESSMMAAQQHDPSPFPYGVPGPPPDPQVLPYGGPFDPHSTTFGFTTAAFEPSLMATSNVFFSPDSTSDLSSANVLGTYPSNTPSNQSLHDVMGHSPFALVGASAHDIGALPSHNLAAQSGTAMCSCLTDMYLRTSELQALVSFDFPACIPTMRAATDTAMNVLLCQECPKNKGSSVINLMQLISLLTLVVERYSRVISWIDGEADRATAADERKPFRMGEARPELAHLHTGEVNIPLGFDLDLTGAEWQSFSRRMLSKEILGPNQGKSLAEMLDLLETRQKLWHEDPNLIEVPHSPVDASGSGHVSCFQFIENIRVRVRRLGL